MARQESSASSAVLGDPIPVGCLNLSREINEDKNELAPNKSRSAVLMQLYAGLGVCHLITTVLQHLELLQRDEAAIHHPVKNRQKLIDLLFGIHDFNDQGQI